MTCARCDHDHPASETCTGAARRMLAAVPEPEMEMTDAERAEAILRIAAVTTPTGRPVRLLRPFRGAR